MRQFDAYEIKPTHESADDGEMTRDSSGADPEAVSATASLPTVRKPAFWTLCGRVEMEVEPIAKVESELAALELLYKITGIEGKPGVATFLAPVVAQGKLLPGRPDAICAIIISDDDIVQATLEKDESGNLTGITRELACRYLAEHGRDVENAFMTSWLDNLKDVESLLDFAERHRELITEQ